VFALACGADHILRRIVSQLAELAFGRVTSFAVAGWLIVVREHLNRDEYLACGIYGFERAAGCAVYEPHKVREHDDVDGVAVEPAVVANGDVRYWARR
jgi:hypothetical protein